MRCDPLEKVQRLTIVTGIVVFLVSAITVVFADLPKVKNTCLDTNQPWEEMALAVCDYQQACGIISFYPGRAECQVWYFYFPVRWREGPLRNDDCYNVPDYTRCQAENCLNGLTCEHFDECDAACFDTHCAFPEES